MGFPAQGMEATFRNPIDQVKRLLDERFPDRYMIFNLSERSYDASKFGFRVTELGFPDHHAPPFTIAWALARAMKSWLAADPENIAVVHCMAGKGRTGVIIACYFLYTGLFHIEPSTDDAAPLDPTTLVRAHGILPFLRRDDTPLHHTGGEPRGAVAAVSAKEGERGSGSVSSRHRGRSGDEGTVATPLDDAGSFFGESCGIPSPDAAGRTHRFVPAVLAARRALHAFEGRRGEGVKYACQARSAVAMARAVQREMARALVAGEAGVEWWEAAEAGSREGDAAAGKLDVVDGLADEAWQGRLRFRAAAEGVKRLIAATEQRLRMATPSEGPRIRLGNMVVSRLPSASGSGVCRPSILVTETPSQLAEARVFHNTAWNATASGLPEYDTSSAYRGPVVFPLDVEVQGDITIRCYDHYQGPGGKLVEQELFRLTLHTAFLQYEPLPGVVVFHRGDVDMDKRKSNISKFPEDFRTDVFYARHDPFQPPLEGPSPASTRRAGGEEDDEEQGAEARPPAGRAGTSRSSRAAPAWQRWEELEEESRHIERRGWITKRGALVKSWKRRWFVLRDRALAYFKTPSDSVPLGHVALGDCDVMESLGLNDAPDKKEHCFQLVTPGRTLVLQCESESERDAWMRPLHVVISALRTPLHERFRIGGPTPPSSSPQRRNVYGHGTERRRPRVQSCTAMTAPLSGTGLSRRNVTSARDGRTAFQSGAGNPMWRGSPPGRRPRLSTPGGTGHSFVDDELLPRRASPAPSPATSTSSRGLPASPPTFADSPQEEQEEAGES